MGHEVDAGLSAFGTLSKLEQYARLKVWIGRFRFYQASQERDAEQTDDLQALSHRVFHQLKWLSRQYEPGYIEAFRQDFSTDWSLYVAEAQEQLVQAIEACRRARNVELLPRERTQSENRASHSSISNSRAVGPLPSATSPVPISPAAPHYASSSSLAGLKALVARGRLPDEGLDQFLAILRQAVDDVGTTHTELLRLAWPFREYITVDDGLGALKRNLERIQSRRDEAKAHEDT